MRRLVVALALIVTIVAVYTAAGKGADHRRITRQALEDKIRGGWAGQMIGVSYGAPTLKVVTRDDSDSRSKGKKVVISKAITYSAPLSGRGK